MGFEQELAGLPGEYAPPTGRLLVALDSGGAVGMVALRRSSEGVAEMRRMYVLPNARSRGLGRALLERLLEEARAQGYASVILDTIPSRMPEAQALYRSIGFSDIERYNDNPAEGVAHMGLEL